MDASDTLAVDTAPDPDAIQAVREGLAAYNRAHAPGDAARPLRLVLRDPAGRIVGGLLGATHWGWLVVEVLWVAEERRGRGCGRALLALAEGEATRRGCRQARLDTMSFQARPFYERVGYSVVGTLRDGLEGHSRYVMQKVLDLDADADEAAEGGDNVATRSPRPHASVWAWDEAGTLP